MDHCPKPFKMIISSSPSNLAILSACISSSISFCFSTPMAILAFLPEPEPESKPKPRNPNRKKRHQKAITNAKQQPPSSWYQIKNLLTCKQIDVSKIHPPSRNNNPMCSSVCAFGDAGAHGNARVRVVHGADNSPENSAVGQEITRLLSKRSSSRYYNRASSSTRSMGSSCGSIRSSSGGGAAGYAGRGMQFRKLSGCYECHAVLDPSMYPLPRTTICACSECGEVFPKTESLEHHQAVRHAVYELGPEDSSRNIVEIIFKSSWLKRDNPICKIERILKVHNSQRTIQRFEDYRDAVKTRATSNSKRNARCAADGNELLRFHCATLMCSLGARGSSSLCGCGPGCGVCTIIRHGFAGGKIGGVGTTASSGRAHDMLGESSSRRAMMVCRVIAGRVKREDAAADEDGGTAAAAVSGAYDSVAAYAGTYSNLEELYVFNSRAILPCFVVIYKALQCS